MQMPELCAENFCTGCEACANSCPDNFITMKSGVDGFLRPEINYALCSGCGKCEISCPVLNPLTLHRNEQPKVYACWHKDEAVRMQSSSGGAFSAIAELVLENKGIVFGAAYDVNLHVHHIGVEHANDLEQLRRSKYVQSEIGTAFRQVKEQLRQGRQVMFVGTPCQVAGLYAFLGSDHENLLTLDFVCHGVPAPGLFKKYVDWLCQILKSDICQFNFRDKRKGWQNVTSSVVLANGERKQLKGRQNSYYHGFIDGISLREACFDCAYMKIPRVADITIADFWGIGEQTLFPYPNEINRGISLLLLNSEKALNRLNLLEGKMSLVGRSLKEATVSNPHLYQPAKPPKNYKDFSKNMANYSYACLARGHFRLPLKRRVILFVKEHCDSDMLGRLRKIYKG